jgi:hypothetical protein
MCTIPRIVVINETSRAVEPAGVNVFPASHTLVIGHRGSEMATDLLNHQFADCLVHLCHVSNLCIAGTIIKLESQLAN